MNVNINQAVERYAQERVKKQEQKQADRILFYILLSMQIVFKDTAKMTNAKRKQLTDEIISKSNEISRILVSNKCVEGRQETFDVDTNIEILNRLAEQYGVEFEEELFRE